MSSTYEQNLQSESMLMTAKNSVILNLNEKLKIIIQIKEKILLVL